MKALIAGLAAAFLFVGSTATASSIDTGAGQQTIAGSMEQNARGDGRWDNDRHDRRWNGRGGHHRVRYVTRCHREWRNHHRVRVCHRVRVRW